MARVFLSRHNTDLHPGQGGSINWQLGERTLVVFGLDKGRIFVVQSEGMSHDETHERTYVREGYFEDDPDYKVAKDESAAPLWFARGPHAQWGSRHRERSDNSWPAACLLGPPDGGETTTLPHWRVEVSSPSGKSSPKTVTYGADIRRLSPALLRSSSITNQCPGPAGYASCLYFQSRPSGGWNPRRMVCTSLNEG